MQGLSYQGVSVSVAYSGRLIAARYWQFLGKHVGEVQLLGRLRCNNVKNLALQWMLGGDFEERGIHPETDRYLNVVLWGSFASH